MPGKARNKKNKHQDDRLLVVGRPEYDRVDNKVVSARYTVWNFLPKVCFVAY